MITDNEWAIWQEQGLYNNSLIRRWVSTWEMSIKHQKHYALALIIKGVSTLLMKERIMIETKTGELDPRVPIIYFSDSGSGKGMGQSFYQSIFKPVGLQISSLSKPTPEKLIGSFDEQTDKENKKKGYTVRDDKWRDPVLHGYFETEDDVIFDEAEIFFDNKEYGNDILRKSRLALDKYGSPNNFLKSETLKNRGGYTYPCKCNIIYLSYHIEKISKQILSNGIFQRGLCFFYRLGQEQMTDILLNPPTNLNSAIKTQKEKLITDLKKTHDHIKGMEQNIQISNEASNHIQKIMADELKHIYRDDDELGKILQSFLPRLRDSIIKISGALAVIKNKVVIEKIEVEEAQTLVLGVSFPSLSRELVVYGVLAEEQKKWYKDLRRYLGGKWRTKEQINVIMSGVWAVSRPTAINRLKKLSAMFVFKKGKKNEQYFKLK